MMGPDRLLMMI